MDIATWKDAILAGKDCLCLVTVLWLLVHTYTKVLPTQLETLQAPVIAAVATMAQEMKSLRDELVRRVSN